MSLEFEVDGAFELAQRLAQKAGYAALKLRNKHLKFKRSAQNDYEGVRDISTEADWKSLRLILRGIIDKGYHSKARVHVEEEDVELPWAKRFIEKFAHKSRYRWTVDSIDGSANYASGTPDGDRMVTKMLADFISEDLEHHLNPVAWGPMIGMESADQPEFGTIYLPMGNKLYCAMRGKGATLKTGATAYKLQTDQKAYFKSSNIIYTNSAFFQGSLQQIGRSGLTVRHHGAYAHSAMRIAEGYAECIISKRPKLHDLIPPMCILREAGGVVVDEKGHDATSNSKIVIFAPNTKYVSVLLETIETRGGNILEREL